MPSGLESVMPISVRITVRGSPPQESGSTGESPKTPPYISEKNTAKAATQAAPSTRTPRLDQNFGTAVSTSISTITAVPTAGLHCSSYGNRPKIIIRHFSATNPQQAPSDAWHAS